MSGRLICLGTSIIDVALAIPDLPERGGDIEGESIGLIPGGATNVMTAARRHGMDVVYAGSHGIGVLGDLVRKTLGELGVEIALPPDSERDTGYTVAMTLTLHHGERSFATPRGTEARLRDGDLDVLNVSTEDTVYISGYALLPSRNGGEIARWIRTIPNDVRVVLDPGPLALDPSYPVLATVLERADWVSAAIGEARALSGIQDAHEAARWLAHDREGALVRLNAAGCLIAQGGELKLVESIHVDAVDTNGAGDAHIGAFIAALHRGESPERAVKIANVAAALKVTRWGPTASPTLAETLAAMEAAGLS